MFQFLIGKVKTLYECMNCKYNKRFQFLIGKVKTWYGWWYDGNAGFVVSIPHR